MSIKKALDEIRKRLFYRNWFTSINIEDGKLIIYIDSNEFFEPNILKNIMKTYDYEFEVKYVNRFKSFK